jgi:hypothetical protein
MNDKKYPPAARAAGRIHGPYPTYIITKDHK